MFILLKNWGSLLKCTLTACYPYGIAISQYDNLLQKDRTQLLSVLISVIRQPMVIKVPVLVHS